MVGRFFALLFGCSAVLFVTHPALADETYSIQGKDSFTVGDRDVRGDIVYAGRETLTLHKTGPMIRCVARADYLRTDQGAQSRAHALFVTLLSPTGEQHDETDDDPDYLTVLNQPFAVALDAATMRAVSRLVERVAFDFRSPISGKTMHGYLSNAGTARVAGVEAQGIVFEARGDLRGFSPGGLPVALNGTIHVRGTAWYALSSALLRAIDTQLTISGTYAGSKDPAPVVIVYRRRMRVVR